MYRNQKLLDLANECSRCMCCGATVAPGAIVAAHSNHQRHGKGTGIKAHDICVAYVCNICHDLIDGRKHDWDPGYRSQRWHEAMANTLAWVAVHHPSVLAAGKLCRS